MIGEFDLIDAFLAQLPHPRPPHGPGDDAAVLPRGRFCITTDAVVEGVHFSRPGFSLEDIGHKALAVNLSDLAAMGASPTWWLCALGLPAGTDVVAIARGMAPLAKGLALVGGNITASPVLSITITAAGAAKRPLLRSGARRGDLLYVSGTLGAAAIGLTAAQKRPTPQVALGLIAARFASAAIDISDGLLADLHHLCAASKVRAAIDSARIPVAPGASLQQALTGGEDYQLLLTVPPRRAARFEAEAKNVTLIGTIVAGRGVTLDGRAVPPKGFDHFRSSRRSSGSGSASRRVRA